MKSGGVILTRMKWKEPFGIFFNFCLLSWHTIFLWWFYRRQVPKEIRKLAARISHVRLVFDGPYENSCVKVLSQTSPIAEIEVWGPEAPDGKSFIYFDPTFEVDDEFRQRMIGYADHLIANKRTRKYDYLQLFSYCINLLIWIVRPSTLGREVCRVMNLRGRGVCSSVAASVLRSGANDFTAYFGKFETAMVSPSLFVISGFWKMSLPQGSEDLA